jgi:hypothetical protein
MKYKMVPIGSLEADAIFRIPIIDGPITVYSLTDKGNGKVDAIVYIGGHMYKMEPIPASTPVWIEEKA